MPTSQPGPPNICAGRTPGYWKNHTESWPAPYVAKTGDGQPATLFNAVFGVPSPYPDDRTLLAALEAGGGYSGPPHDVARHVGAALLNIAADLVPVLNIGALVGIWRQYIDTGGGTAGYFEPTAGVQWDHEEIVAYLLTTMPV